MRLVHREQRDRRLARHAEEVLAGAALRRDVEQAQRSRPQRRKRVALLALRNLTVEGGNSRIAALAQICHLVAHQRDQRRDDQHRAWQQQRRLLVDQRLAAARGQDDERVVAVQHCRDGFTLAGPELGLAEEAVKGGFRCGNGQFGGGQANSISDGYAHRTGADSLSNSPGAAWSRAPGYTGRPGPASRP